MIDFARAALGFRHSPVVVVFHDVPDRGWFETCIDAISSARQVLPLSDLVQNPKRKRVCAITFDDGRRSVWDVAHPVLDAAGLPYTTFVCTEMLSGGPVPWFVRLEQLIDRIGIQPIKGRWNLGNGRLSGRSEVATALKQVPLPLLEEGLNELEETHAIARPDPFQLFVSPEEVSALSAAGVTIGSHSHRHPILSLLSEGEQRLEIERSTEAIEGFTGDRPTAFAYPNGSPLDFDQTTIGILRAAGFELAVTTTQRYLTLKDEPFALPRIGVEDGDSSARMIVKHLAPSLSRSHRREEQLRALVAGLATT